MGQLSLGPFPQLTGIIGGQKWPTNSDTQTLVTESACHCLERIAEAFEFSIQYTDFPKVYIYKIR